MKIKALILSAFLFLAASLCAQEVVYVDDESCGCELVFIDGIQTTTDGTYYGFRRADGTVIAPNIYLHVDEFHDGYCKVMFNDTTVGMIDRDGNTIAQCIYSSLEYPTCGRIHASIKGKHGFLDLKGNVVIPLKYRLAGEFVEDRAQVLVEVDSLTMACTFIDTNGTIVLKPIYENLMPYNGGYAPAQRYQRWGVIDRDGHEVLPYVYENIVPLQGSLCMAGDDDGMALFDLSVPHVPYIAIKPITPFSYTWTSGIVENRIGVMRDGKYGFLDINGKEIIPCIYDETGIFRLGRTMARIGNRYGIIDTMGNTILPIEYGNTTHKGIKYMYYDSLAMVEKDGKLGYVDLNGKLVIPFYFDDGYPFSQKLACVKYNEQWGYITTEGEIFLPFIFQIASPYRWGRAEVVYMGNVSAVDLKWRCVKNCNGVIAWRDWRK